MTPPRTEQKVAQIQKLPRKRCPLCGEELKHPASKKEREKQWRRHRRRHYNWRDR